MSHGCKVHTYGNVAIDNEFANKRRHVTKMVSPIRVSQMQEKSDQYLKRNFVVGEKQSHNALRGFPKGLLDLHSLRPIYRAPP